MLDGGAANLVYMYYWNLLMLSLSTKEISLAYLRFRVLEQVLVFKVVRNGGSGKSLRNISDQGQTNSVANVRIIVNYSFEGGSLCPEH